LGIKSTLKNTGHPAPTPSDALWLGWKTWTATKRVLAEGDWLSRVTWHQDADEQEQDAQSCRAKPH
jgi:hypothetical protein